MTDTTDRDLSRAIRSWLHEDRHEDASRVAGAVLDQVEADPQRRATGWRAWRIPLMNKFVSLGLGAAAVVVALVIGYEFLGPAAPGGVGAAPSAVPTASPTPAPSAVPTASPTPTPIGGTVRFKSDGVATTTVVNAVADGTKVTGTAVSTSSVGTHTVRLECAARQGDRWAFVGTTEQTTFPDEATGAWSAVVVEDGTPQKIGIVFSIEKLATDRCAGKWNSISMADMSVSNPVESGELVPPPDLAP